MKRKIMFAIVILAIGMMSVSCFKKKKEEKQEKYPADTAAAK